LEHTEFTHATALPHWPDESQVCTAEVPEHWVELGVQLPEQVPEPEQTKGHVCVVCQAPDELQVWAAVPEHWLDPGTHEPEQAPALQADGHVVSTSP
jgi:hypothetical protein